MSVLDDHLKKHRKRIIDREAAAFRELLTAYRVIDRELAKTFKALQKKIIDARAAGETVSPSWLYRERRLQALIDQVKTQIERFGQTAAGITSAEQEAAIELAIDQARSTIDLVRGAGAVGMRFNPLVVENAVGMMGDGSPILEYYRKNLAPKVAEMIRVEVIKATAQGTSFETIANRLMKTGQITRTRALATARTEVNRVRRETTRQFFEQNKDVISGWEWVSAKSPRTCPACLALDGRIFKVDQVFPQHINCRCTLIAVIDGVPRPKRELGSEWFDRQADDVKEQIIGVDGLAAYKDGIVKLKDFVGWKNSREFGRSIYTKPLSHILMNAPAAKRVIATPKRVKVLFNNSADDVLEQMLGRKLSPDEIGGLVGALDGSKITVSRRPGGLMFNVSHAMIARQERILRIDHAGHLTIHNNYFRKKRTAPGGLGLKSFAIQAHHAETFGIKYIDTHAAGDYASSQQRTGFNGYYTWARMGYNAPLDPADVAKFPRTFRNVRNLNDLFEQANGKFVWKYLGSGRDMYFDLDRQSKSWAMLTKYLQDKGFTINFGTP